MITFEVPGKPRGKGRPRFYNGHAITPADTASYENLVKVMYLGAGGQIHEGPLIVRMTAFYPIAKSCSKKKRQQMLDGEIKPTVKADLDNVLKIILDGLNGVAFKDDVQVVGFNAKKVYGEEAKVIITIEEA